MKIAQVAPLIESVPPQSYGGTERVVSYLTEALVADGHDVTLFASGDSRTTANLVSACPRSLRLDRTCVDTVAHHALLLETVWNRLDDFDIVHWHIDYLHYPLSRRRRYAHVTTLHGRLDLPDLVPLYREFHDMPVVSISNAQRAPLPWIDWRGTVYHGLPEDLYTFHETPGAYLAFVGRASPEKRLDCAIRIARQVGIPLRIAAKVDKTDREYFDAQIRPLLDSPLIEFIGEIGDEDKNDFLGNALALMFPINWPEPFGLVMIESLACGTPVIACHCGSVPEVIDHGRTGFVVEPDGCIGAAADAVRALPMLDRRECRSVFEQRFSSTRMARDYLDVYRQILMRDEYLSPLARSAS